MEYIYNVRYNSLTYLCKKSAKLATKSNMANLCILPLNMNPCTDPNWLVWKVFLASSNCNAKYYRRGYISFDSFDSFGFFGFMSQNFSTKYRTKNLISSVNVPVHCPSFKQLSSLLVLVRFGMNLLIGCPEKIIEKIKRKQKLQK